MRLFVEKERRRRTKHQQQTSAKKPVNAESRAHARPIREWREAFGLGPRLAGYPANLRLSHCCRLGRERTVPRITVKSILLSCRRCYLRLRDPRWSAPWKKALRILASNSRPTPSPRASVYPISVRHLAARSRGLILDHTTIARCGMKPRRTGLTASA